METYHLRSFSPVGCDEFVMPPIADTSTVMGFEYEEIVEDLYVCCIYSGTASNIDLLCYPSNLAV